MKLSTTTRGNGSRTAALVHGMTASALYWEHFARLLVEEHDCTVTLVDLRGHGDSPRADRYHVDDFSTDLVETLPQGLDYLIGQSLGGRAVIGAAAGLQPKHLIPIDPGLHAVPWFKLVVKYFPTWIQFRMPDVAIRKLMYGDALAPEEAAAAVARVRTGWAKFDPKVRHGIVASALAEPWVPFAPVVPTTMVIPEKSFVVPPPLVAELRALGWDIRVMPGVTHDLHVQDPAGALRLLADVIP